MKSFVFLGVCLLLSISVNSQNRDHFKSDIITYNTIDSMWVEIKPLHNDTTSTLIVNGINESLVMNKLLGVLNDFREGHGASKVSHDIQTTRYLVSSLVHGLPLNDGFTWSTYGSFSEYGYISNTEDVETAFCQYLIDIMSLDYDLFKTIVDPNNTKVGFYFSQDSDEKSYTFIIFIK